MIDQSSYPKITRKLRRGSDRNCGTNPRRNTKLYGVQGYVTDYGATYLPSFWPSSDVSAQAEPSD